MDRVRVVHVITRFDKGGSAENTFLTLRGLDGRRYEGFLACGSPGRYPISPAEERAVEENLAALAALGVEVITLPHLVREIRPLSDLRAFVSLLGLFRRLRPVIVHTHTSKAGILGRWAAWLCRVPVIVHTPHGHVFWGYFGPAETRLFILFERLSALVTHRIITLTEQERRDHLRFRIAPAGRFTVIHSGVDLSRLSPPDDETLATVRAGLVIPPHGVIIGTVGRLTGIKGHDTLLEAAARIRAECDDLYLVFIGDGELREDLENRAKGLGLADRVVFTGWRRDVAPLLALFDIFVFPSLNEGMGKAVVEAMAMGKPVVASRIGGIVDLVEDNVNGLLVPPGDPAALAEAVLSLLRDGKRRVAMGKEGLKRAVNLGDRTMVERLGKVYEELLSTLPGK